MGIYWGRSVGIMWSDFYLKKNGIGSGMFRKQVVILPKDIS